MGRVCVQPLGREKRNKREGSEEREEKREEGGDRRMGPTCHVYATLALNGHFNTI